MNTSEFVDDILVHFGVKGMRWGVRRETNGSGSSGAGKSRREARQERQNAKIDDRARQLFKDPREYLRLQIDLNNAVAGRMNDYHIPRINNKPEYRKAADSGTFLNENHPTTKKYFKEYQDTYVREINDYLSGLATPSGKISFRAQVSDSDNFGFSVRLIDKDAQHADESEYVVEFIKDAKGQITGFKIRQNSLTQSDEFVDEFLAHFGVKGMRWGVRKEVHPDIADVPKKTRKEAAKDAEEFTRAKMYFGEGAGTRRKLINTKVEAKKKQDKFYEKAFDHFVNQTDMAKRSQQARKERKSTDRKTSTKKTAKKLVRALESELYYSDEAVDNFLAHFGVKGMRWGVRRKATVDAREVIVSDKRKKLKTSGGKGLEAHPDAIPARIVGQKIKKSGLKSVSDQELNAYARRIQMEQNVSRLMYNEKSAGKRFIDNVLGRQGSKLANEATKVGATKAGRSALNAATRRSRRAAKVAATVALA